MKRDDRLKDDNFIREQENYGPAVQSVFVAVLFAAGKSLRTVLIS